MFALSLGGSLKELKMSKKQRRDKKILLIILIIILFFVIILNTSLFNQLSEIVEIKEIEASIIVSDKVGFDLNSTALIFGKVLPGGSSSKFVDFENNFGFPVEIYIYGEGEMKKFITPFKEKIEKGGKKNIKISAFVPLDAEFGNYSGKVVIKIKKNI